MNEWLRDLDYEISLSKASLFCPYKLVLTKITFTVPEQFIFDLIYILALPQISNTTRLVTSKYKLH